MARLLIPTRNRPTSLRQVLVYLRRFHPGTGVIIADGSASAHAAANAATVAALSGALDIDYRAYPEPLPLFERLLDCLESLDDETLITGADDDYPQMQALQRADQALRAAPDLGVALGGLLKLRWTGSGELKAAIKPARDIRGGEPALRMRRYAAWPFPTSYAAARRTLLVSRYRRAATLFHERVFDYMVGLHDAARGAIHAEPDIGFVLTENAAHSHLRDQDPIAVLRHADKFLQAMGFIAEDLHALGGLDAETAEAIAGRLIRRRVAVVAGQELEELAGFSTSTVFGDAKAQAQLRLAAGMFSAAGEAREAWLERLRFILEADRVIAASDDNAGEARTYASPGAQLAGASAPLPAPRAGRGKTRAPGAHERLGLEFILDPQSLLRVEAVDQ